MYFTRASCRISSSNPTLTFRLTLNFFNYYKIKKLTYIKNKIKLIYNKIVY